MKRGPFSGKGGARAQHPGRGENKVPDLRLPDKWSFKELTIDVEGPLLSFGGEPGG